MPQHPPMLDLTRAPQSDPLRLYRYRDGIYAVDLLIAAVVHLDFFTWLDARPADPATICRELGLAARPVDVMLTLFTANGFVRREHGVFHVTAVAREHLVKGSPWFLGPYFGSLKDRPVALDLLKVLRTDKPANWGSSKSEKEWTKAMEEPDFAERFTAAMDCRGIYLGRAVAQALDLRGRARLLDIAGGSGIYACAISAAHPHLRATVLEKPPVDRVASQLIAGRGHADARQQFGKVGFEGSPGIGFQGTECLDERLPERAGRPGGHQQVVFAEEAGGQGKSGQGQRPDDEGPVGDRQFVFQAAHVAHVLLVVQGDDHRAATQEEQGFERAVRQ